MPFSDILDPEQLAILAGVLNDVCLAAGIQPLDPERQDVARLVLQFYGRGYGSADELRAALDKAMRDERRYG
jgi:hypothetical protein